MYKNVNCRFYWKVESTIEIEILANLIIPDFKHSDSKKKKKIHV